MATDEIITRTVIAATPGWFVAQFEKGGTFNDNHEDKLNYYAVIAWESAVNAHGQARNRGSAKL